MYLKPLPSELVPVRTSSPKNEAFVTTLMSFQTCTTFCPGDILENALFTLFHEVRMGVK